ncbi:phosphotransferase [Nocardia neocaledoniensis]|uniref:phosphotransferase n=1 Tax=Nocardia neocaledoniensis TaxID=236511 RepID=UPI002454CAF6|nr:phosphotransferase [Nocardia neocaledoniensis]
MTRHSDAVKTSRPLSVPEWLPRWCDGNLGAALAELLFTTHSISTVFGLRLTDGRAIVMKARPDDGRAAACVTAQAALAARGFPCARPLTPALREGHLAVHAEQYRPGGDLLRGDSPPIARRCAAVFARLAGELAELNVPPPLPNPRWSRWDHHDPGLWPAIPELDERAQHAVPGFVVEAAARARERLLATDLPCVLGHADFEAQNLRWHDGEIYSVHDWDSLAWQPEAALAGASSGTFASESPPTLAPIESSAAFLAEYQERRGRRFTAEECEVAWAASVWPAAHNARWEYLHGVDPLCGNGIRAQAAERLRRAGLR